MRKAEIYGITLPTAMAARSEDYKEDYNGGRRKVLELHEQYGCVFVFCLRLQIVPLTLMTEM